MVTKPASSGKKTTRRKATSTAPSQLTESSVIALRESAQTVMPAPTSTNPEVRHQLVATEAYFIAERRGFAAGNELDDWLAAEAAVDSRLQQMPVAKRNRVNSPRGTSGH